MLDIKLLRQHMRNFPSQLREQAIPHDDILHQNLRANVAAAGVRGIRDISDMGREEKKNAYEKYHAHATEHGHEPISEDDYHAKLSRRFA